MLFINQRNTGSDCVQDEVRYTKDDHLCSFKSSKIIPVQRSSALLN